MQLKQKVEKYNLSNKVILTWIILSHHFVRETIFDSSELLLFFFSYIES